MLISIVYVLEAIFGAFIGWGAVYFLVFAIASRFYKESSVPMLGKKYKVLVLIPSYKEDSVIVNTAREAVLHDSELCVTEIWVIADSLQPPTLDALKQTGANVLPVAFEKSTKAQSINKALGMIESSYDYVLVLDADNVMAPKFVDRIVLRLQKGYSIVQGHRTAKNTNTPFAVLDGLSEEVNNAIFRKGHRSLGLSAALIGSGFACEYKLFVGLMNNIKAVGGFDKELELALLSRNIRIGYAQHAIVFDEKIQHSEAFVNQRRRWLSAQYVYLGRNVGNAFYQLFVRFNIDYFDKILQFLMLPRIITLGAAAFMITGNILLWEVTGNNVFQSFLLTWSIIFGVALLAIIFSVPHRILNKTTLVSALSLPKGFLLTVLAMTKLRGANRRFIHTQHHI